VGGLVGYNNAGCIIDKCYSTGAIISTSDYVGGIVGTNYGIVRNCYSKSAVTGNIRVGGIMGMNTNPMPGTTHALIENCYATGTIRGVEYVGGILGAIQNSAILQNCVAANDSIIVPSNATVNRILGISSAAGTYIVRDGSNYADSALVIVRGGSVYSPGNNERNGIRKHLSTLQKLSFYTTAENWYDGAWSITPPTGAWDICDGKGLPFLRWQEELNCNEILPPDILSPSNITSTSFTANWSAVAGATDYFLNVYTKTKDNVSVFEDFVGNVTSYTIAGLTLGTTYYYTVQAKVAGELSELSEEAEVTTINIDYNMWKINMPDGNTEYKIIDGVVTKVGGSGTVSEIEEFWQHGTNAFVGYDLFITPSNGIPVTGSSMIRTELRELQSDGITNAAWNYAGTHKLEVEVKAQKIGGGSTSNSDDNRTVICQCWGPSLSMLELYYLAAAILP
jgi:hypothetical protein